MFFKHFFIYIQNHLLYFRTKSNKVTNFHYLNKLYFNELSIVIGYIKKKNLIITLFNYQIITKVFYFQKKIIN